jgi:hypothetical protein
MEAPTNDWCRETAITCMTTMNKGARFLLFLFLSIGRLFRASSLLLASRLQIRHRGDGSRCLGHSLGGILGGRGGRTCRNSCSSGCFAGSSGCSIGGFTHRNRGLVNSGMCSLRGFLGRSFSRSRQSVLQSHNSCCKNTDKGVKDRSNWKILAGFRGFTISL